MRHYWEIFLTETGGDDKSVISEASHLIHRAIIDQSQVGQPVKFGISYPTYSLSSLGKVIRVFGSNEDETKKLDLHTYLKRICDFVLIHDVQSIPEAVSYARFSRKRLPRGSREYPYLDVRSSSGGRWFRLHIQKEKVRCPIYIGFNSYGLSGQSSVPDF